MSAATIRRAVASDAEALLELARGLARSQGEPDDRLTLREVRRDMLGEDATVELLVAEADGKASGYIMLLPAYEASYVSRGFYVSHLYVAEAIRGQGIGRRLMAEAAHLAKSRGGGHLWLTMLPKNTAADRFYRRIADIRVDVVAHVVANEAFDRLAAEATSDTAGAANDKEG